MLKADQFVKSIVPSPHPRQFLVLCQSHPENCGMLIPFNSLKALKLFMKGNNFLQKFYTILELTPSDQDDYPNYTIIKLEDL